MTFSEPPKKPRTPRRSLTPAQRATAAGAELLALCESTTADGRLEEDEVQALRHWLEDNADTDLPARDHLRAVVREILADGKVTPTELQELYRAIESVLPPELRDVARLRRRSATEEDRARAREERARAREEARAEREGNRPVESANFMVAGVRYEGRPALIERYANEGDTIYLRRDRANRHSRHAIAVLLENGVQIGFAPEADAVELAPLLDDGLPHTAMITKILTGGRSPIPVVQAHFYRTDASVEGLVREHETPQPAGVTARRSAAPSRGVTGPSARTGCLGAMLLTITALAAAGGAFVTAIVTALR